MLATLEVQMSSIESCPPCNQYCSLQHDAKSYNKLCRKQNLKNVNEYSFEDRFFDHVASFIPTGK